MMQDKNAQELPGNISPRTSGIFSTFHLPGFMGRWGAWLVMLASLLITFNAWYFVRGEATKRVQARFDFRIKTIETGIYERLQAYEFLLRGGSGLFEASDEVTREEWRTYVTKLQINQYYPGIQGVGFSKQILPSEKEAHLRQIRSEGFPQYTIKPEGDRPEYTSIIFLEPFDWRNQRAFGYDMFSEPTRKEAMVRARDTGIAALSGKVTLVQETVKDIQAGFLIYLAIYRKGEPLKTQEQRHEALMGYVYSPFRMNDFMKGILEEKKGYINLQIFDGKKPLEETLLYRSDATEEPHSAPEGRHFATAQSILTYAGHHWLLSFVSSKYFEEHIETGSVKFILLLGITISLLLFGIVLSLTKSRSQAIALANTTLDLENANIELRKEITERNQSEKARLESEERYRLLLQKANDAIYVHEINPDGPGRFLEVNDKACNLLGYTRAELLKMGISDIAVPEQAKNIPLIIKQLHQSGEAIFFTEDLTKDGRRIPVEVSASIFDYGSIPSVLSIVRDISTRKAAENEIIRSRDTQKAINELLRASVTEQPVELILKNCLDIILSIQWLTVESKGCIFLVEDRKDILIMKVQKGLDKEIEAKCAEIPFGKCICGRAALSAKVEFADKIDERHDIYIERGMDEHGHYCIPILSESETLGVINIYLEAGHSYDETEVEFLSAVANTLAGIILRRYAQKEKQQIEMKLSHAQRLESIGTLAGGIAHDFNNILFPIIGYAEMILMDTPEDSPVRDSLNQIYTSALRARSLVKQILTFSRQESGELILMKMQPVVKEALKLIRSTISTTIEIKQDINPDCGVIKADPTQIHQIVMNLTTNAYHAMEEVGGELKVSLKEVEIGEYDIITPDMIPGIYACLTVADQGVGMDKNLTEKIFDPFFTTKAKGKGTGMGLSVVHGIVTTMGGAIHVYSEPGKGTQFHVYLPVEKTLSEEQTTTSKVQIQGGTEQVLLVDDEEAILGMEKRMLERLGYQVTSRFSSLEALEAFRDSPDKFDLVITDMAMPNMPGDKLSVELTKIRPDIPILLCTGFSETMSEEKATSLGIKGFILKPIVMKDLAQKIREILDEN